MAASDPGRICGNSVQQTFLQYLLRLKTRFQRFRHRQIGHKSPPAKKKATYRYGSCAGHFTSMYLTSGASGNRTGNQVISRLFTVGPRSLLTIAMLVNLNACTDSLRQDSPPIPKFKSVAIVNKGVSNELKARFGVAPEDSSTDTGVLAGAGTGAMVAAHASLGCVGFVILCALATVPVGAMLGAVGGGLADHAVDSQKRLSREQLLVLDGLFAQVLQQRTINEEIESSLLLQVPVERNRDVSEADTLLQFRLYDVRFSKTSQRKYPLTLKTVMLIDWNRTDPRKCPPTRRMSTGLTPCGWRTGYKMTEGP